MHGVVWRRMFDSVFSALEDVLLERKRRRLEQISSEFFFFKKPTSL